jgi:glycosyltransferase involved in cell wall biosynthesis
MRNQVVMRFAVVGPTYPFRGGISHYNTLLCDHLRERHEVGLFSFRRQYPRWLFPGKSDRDSSQRSLSTPNTPILDSVDPLSWWRTAQRIVAFRPDLLILHWWVTYWALPFASITAWVSRHGVPVLYLVHNVLPHERKPWDRLLTRLAMARTDRFIVMSGSEEQQLHDLRPRAMVYRAQLPGGIGTAEARHSVSPAEARQQLGLDPSTPVALFFGFVRAYKGLRYLLEAMPQVLAKMRLHLLIAGEFWEGKEECQEIIDHLGLAISVTVVDRYIRNEEVSVYFSAADVVVLPYVGVTQSAVVQLAYAFGKPVITTAVGDLPDIVLHHKTGWIVPPGDAGALADALIGFYSQGWGQSMREAILAREPESSWTVLVELIEQIAREARGCPALAGR